MINFLVLTFIFAVLTPAQSVRAVVIGQTREVEIKKSLTEIYENSAAELSEFEVTKVHVYPTGRKRSRPSDTTPLQLWVSTPNAIDRWTLPWRPVGGVPLQWMEVLLCHNEPSVTLTASTNSSVPVPVRWRVSTENVALANGVTLKSSPADVSYRRHRWRSGAQEIELSITALAGVEACATVVVTPSCVTQPYQLTEDHVLLRVHFTRQAELTLSREDAPDGFWLYLIPEGDDSVCSGSPAASPSGNLPPAKTVRVITVERAFKSGSAPSTFPASEESLPQGIDINYEDEDSSWTCPPPDEVCSDRILQLQLDVADERLVNARLQRELADERQRTRNGPCSG